MPIRARSSKQYRTKLKLARSHSLSSAHHFIHIASLSILMHPVTMRTTITMDQDVHEYASVYAAARGLTLSSAVNELIRKAKSAPEPEPDVYISPLTGLRAFPPTGETITAELIKKIEAEEYDPRLFA
jgi:hypothetical protein